MPTSIRNHNVFFIALCTKKTSKEIKGKKDVKNSENEEGRNHLRKKKKKAEPKIV